MLPRQKTDLGSIKSSTPSYELGHKAQILGMLGVATALYLASAVASSKLPEIILDVARLVALIAVGYSFYFILTDRTTFIGFIYFSTLGAGNTAAVGAMNAALVDMVYQILTMVLTSVSGFFSLKPRAKA